jgi:DNA helicase HerA-like ATPase
MPQRSPTKREGPAKQDGKGPRDGPLAPPDDFLTRLDADITASGGEAPVDPEMAGAIGATMFDVAGSQDNTVTVLLSQGNVQLAPSQALVRIKSRSDGRIYLGIVTAGPFAEPDSLRGDSPMLVTVVTRGGIYLPPYHGRIQVSILGEKQHDGTLSPPRLRPLPNSPVFALNDEESAAVLRADGDIRLGLVAGHDHVVVGVPSDQKSVLPRHTAVLGTTGGGKSTTIARLVQQAQAAGMAVILLDVEGEYTHLHEPTADPRMLTGLAERDLKPAGVPADHMTLYYLVGRETANPEHPDARQFSLQFARLSPYAVIEILGLSPAQEERFLKAYDVAKEMLRELDIFPKRGDAAQERMAMELDEFERGYPRLTLSLMMDVVAACLSIADKAEIAPFNAMFKTDAAKATLKAKIHSMNVPPNAISWRALLGRLARLNRLKVFDNPSNSAKPLTYKTLLTPGSVSVIDLSDSGMSELNNIVIADLLRGVQDAQDEAYQAYEAAKTERPDAPPPTRTLIIIEEAHEFLSAERVEKMSTLFEQVARIAKRGRKRWLGLVFVTQLPQHLPRQVFGLVNSYILHKITDPQVVSTLHRTVSGIDESLWNRLPGLAPGQAIVSFPHMARPLLVSIDPAPAKLRLID